MRLWDLFFGRAVAWHNRRRLAAVLGASLSLVGLLVGMHSPVGGDSSVLAKPGPSVPQHHELFPRVEPSRKLLYGYTDIFLKIAERVWLGQTYYCKRIRYFQHPDADGNPDRLIQVRPPPGCPADNTDDFINIVRPWLDVEYGEFTEHASDCELANFDPVNNDGGACFAYWFVEKP